MLPFVFIKTTLLRMTARKRLIFFFTLEFRNCVEFSSMLSGLTSHSNWRCNDQFQTKIRNITRRDSRFPKCAKLGHFTKFLFYKGRLCLLFSDVLVAVAVVVFLNSEDDVKCVKTSMHNLLTAQVPLFLLLPHCDVTGICYLTTHGNMRWWWWR